MATEIWDKDGSCKKCEDGVEPNKNKKLCGDIIGIISLNKTCHSKKPDFGCIKGLRCAKPTVLDVENQKVLDKMGEIC